MKKWVYTFEEGSASMRDLLGGKGANLAEMTRMGIRVPPGFTITTEACREYLASGRLPEGLWEQVREGMSYIEGKMGRRFGDPREPLLVSVRSGAPVSMPGMMDTILNLGLNDEAVEGLARMTGNPRFAWDSYRRFIQMFGSIVMGVPKEAFDEAFEAVKRERGAEQDIDLDAEGMREVAIRFKRIYEEHVGSPFPQDPWEQLRLAIEAVFRSWNNRRA
ncbi:MAG TPA: pyruvate, phosphate dikinase, partial [Aciduliprofundum sp.]|nr:pyruvate, phosphate dikinase [Aciduliprofundum sp.]